MVIEPPDFINSKYLIIDSEGWHLKDNAPKELQIEFNNFIQFINNEGGE